MAVIKGDTRSFDSSSYNPDRYPYITLWRLRRAWHKSQVRLHRITGLKEPGSLEVEPDIGQARALNSHRVYSVSRILGIAGFGDSGFSQSALGRFSQPSGQGPVATMT